MKKLSEILESGISHKDEHSIEITRNITLTCKFHLVVDYEGGTPDAYTNRYFVYEDSESEEKIIFKSESDIEPDLNVDWMDEDIVAIRIKKLLSPEEEENASERDKRSIVFLSLANTRKLMRAAKHLKWMAYYMYSGAENILKSIDEQMK
ncbi:hypothetical protein L1D14_26500 [Vibrio tubiashii]|uniref:hypothetical protein n=1 Tax=Vibrio tubiashii TaxID=29498 RepID=UPI001EFE6A56|nr:hypothetical protein [Vibrio tubiashii]MCG9579758.1 hypothetical protein [Vibrio tubiashii]